MTNPIRERVEKFGGKIIGHDTDSSLIICSCTKGHVFPLLPIALLEKNRWCLKCKKSRGEEIIEKALQDLGIRYISDYYLPESPNYSFPFYFRVKKERFLILYNSLNEQPIREFEEIPLRSRERERNRIKINLGLHLGYRVILFDYKQVKFAKECIFSSIRAYC